MVVSSNGKFSQAVSSLHRKALGAYFSLRGTIDRRFIDATSLNKLFNTLVCPILMYGCQVWCPTTPILKTIITSFRKVSNFDQLLPKLAKSSHEQVHLRHLKYLLGISKRSSNLASWSETGRFPLVFESIKLSIDYFKRVMNLSPSLLVRAAMNEQIRLQLSWFSNVKDLIECFSDTNQLHYQPNSSPILNATSANIPLERRKCQFCESHEIADVLEDEDHALHVCPIGNHVRTRLRSKLPNLGDELNLAQTFQRRQLLSSGLSSGIKLSNDEIREIKLKTRAINNIYSLVLSFKKTGHPTSAQPSDAP